MCSSRQILRSLSVEFVALLKDREVCRKRQTLETWNVKFFGPSVEQRVTPISSDSKEKTSSRLKPLLESETPKKQNVKPPRHCSRICRSRKNLSKTSRCPSPNVDSNDEKDYTASNICKEIVETGTFGSTKREIRPSSCSFIIDYLSIGRRKYTEFRRFMKSEMSF